MGKEVLECDDGEYNGRNLPMLSALLLLLCSTGLAPGNYKRMARLSQGGVASNTRSKSPIANFNPCVGRLFPQNNISRAMGINHWAPFPNQTSRIAPSIKRNADMQSSVSSEIYQISKHRKKRFTHLHQQECMFRIHSSFRVRI